MTRPQHLPTRPTAEEEYVARTDEPIETRTETDSLGSVEVPADAYWGVHTMRALENFPISKRPISVYPDLVIALAQVKQAAARANREVGALSPKKAALIDEACQRIIDGELNDQFVVGVIQGGAGTSTNMNANEVIANLALEIAGYPKGRYDIVHPIDDVNRSQSTNDTYPTALKLAMTASLTTMLYELDQLRIAFGRKGREFAEVLKVGRTQLQDAVPMTLGQEFHGFATTLGEDIARLRETIKLLSEVNLGGTAVGTGITADPGYGASVVRHLSEITGQYLETAPDLHRERGPQRGVTSEPEVRGQPGNRRGRGLRCLGQLGDRPARDLVRVRQNVFGDPLHRTVQLGQGPLDQLQRTRTAGSFHRRSHSVIITYRRTAHSPHRRCR